MTASHSLRADVVSAHWANSSTTTKEGRRPQAPGASAARISSVLSDLVAVTLNALISSVPRSSGVRAR